MVSSILQGDTERKPTSGRARASTHTHACAARASRPGHLFLTQLQQAANEQTLEMAFTGRDIMRGGRKRPTALAKRRKSRPSTGAKFRKHPLFTTSSTQTTRMLWAWDPRGMCGSYNKHSPASQHAAA